MLFRTARLLNALRAKRPFLGLRDDRVTAEGRGVQLHGKHRERTDRAALAFVAGYNATLRHRWKTLPPIESIEAPASDAGFVVEGAAMAAAITDLMLPRRPGTPRLPFTRRAREAYGRTHPHTFHCGVGWAFAVLGRRPEPAVAELDPLLRWLAFDGYGFCVAFLAVGPAEAIRPPRRWGAVERSHFDQGVGRALWFLGNPSDLPARIDRFDSGRHGDLWGGVGLAACYAGAEDAAVSTLATDRPEHAADLAVGAVAAAVARDHGQVWTDTVASGLKTLTGLTRVEAVSLHDELLDGLDPVAQHDAYARWRTRVRAHFARPGSLLAAGDHAC